MMEPALVTTTLDTLGEPLSEQELCPDALLAGQEAAFHRDILRLQARRAEFVDVACPACGADDAAPIFSKHTFAYGRCAACATIYMSPRPSEAVMADYYASSENYRYWATHIFPASEDARREKVHRPWLERVIAACAGLRRPRLLEVGAGFGTFAALAAGSGRFEDVTVVEPTPELAAHCAARGLNVILHRIEDVPAGARADVIVSFEVIEHLFEPHRMVDACAAMLQPGGLLVLSCPNGLGFDIAMLGAASLAVDPEHVNLFNPRSLSRLVESCGFEVVSLTTPGRLDVEFVHDAIARGETDVSDPFLRRVLVDEYDRLGWPFQQFLASHGLSSHMWLVARRRAAS
ncbi:MAG: class I SAM-dependent methyltransferase [Phycisphaerales bacterium]|nr:class I SAM-dependent methyltransferase [Phycisphaerales bacterium]